MGAYFQKDVALEDLIYYMIDYKEELKIIEIGIWAEWLKKAAEHCSAGVATDAGTLSISLAPSPSSCLRSLLSSPSRQSVFSLFI
jgi:hypothetical protein